MPSSRTEKPRADATKPNPAAPSQTELQTQRADREGMTPTTPQRQSAPKNEGEGNRTADRSYREGVKRFIEGGRSEEAADQAAKAVDSEEGEALRRAEQLGKAKQKLTPMTNALERAKNKVSGRVLVPGLLWMAGMPLGIVVLLWFFFFRGR